MSKFGWIWPDRQDSVLRNEPGRDINLRAKEKRGLKMDCGVLLAKGLLKKSRTDSKDYRGAWATTLQTIMR